MLFHVCVLKFFILLSTLFVSLTSEFKCKDFCISNVNPKDNIISIEHYGKRISERFTLFLLVEKHDKKYVLKDKKFHSSILFTENGPYPFNGEDVDVEVNLDNLKIMILVMESGEKYTIDLSDKCLVAFKLYTDEKKCKYLLTIPPTLSYVPDEKN